MQGRLSKPIEKQIQAFPTNNWENEFQIAEKIGFEVIEYVFDSLDNPIMNEEGIDEILNTLDKTNVKINSLCADYFMKNLLFKIDEEEIRKNFDILKYIIQQCSKLGIRIIELPFVDSSSLIPNNNIDEIFLRLKNIIPQLEKFNICLALETDLHYTQFVELLEKFNHPLVRANYDIGNSTYKGYDPIEEIKNLKKFIVNIHIKDRILGGTTVTLGKGDVDFNSFFEMLSQIEYSGDLIIQGAREDLSESKKDHLQTCSEYLNFVRKFTEKY